MIIDCDTCVARDIACGDCVVRVLLAAPAPALEEPEVAALAVLAEGGLVPPLRLLPPAAGPSRPAARSPELRATGDVRQPGERERRPGMPGDDRGDRAVG